MDDSPNEQNSAESPQETGPFIGIVIVVILIALGGIYFLITKALNPTPQPLQEQANS